MNRSKNVAATQAWNAGRAWWDLMTGFQREWQRASLQAFSTHGRSDGARIADTLPQPTSGVRVVELGEERLNVGTLTIQGETTRVRRRVVAAPVEQRVTLRDEKVVVERRPSTDPNPAPNVLTETVIEMSDSRQVPTVWKTLHVAGEVVLRRQVTERVEQVRETLRHDVVDVEHAREQVVAEPRLPETTLEIVSAHHDMEAERLAAQAASIEKRAHDASPDRKPLQDLAPPSVGKKN